MITTRDPITGQRFVDGGAQLYGLMRKAHDLAASTTYNATEILGFTVDAAGSSTWTAVFVDGGTITFTATAGKDYFWHLSSITSPTGGTAILSIP